MSLNSYGYVVISELAFNLNEFRICIVFYSSYRFDRSIFLEDMYYKLMKMNALITFIKFILNQIFYVIVFDYWNNKLHTILNCKDF